MKEPSLDDPNITRRNHRKYSDYFWVQCPVSMFYPILPSKKALAYSRPSIPKFGGAQ